MWVSVFLLLLVIRGDAFAIGEASQACRERAVLSVDRHVDGSGLHLRGVILEDREFGIDAIDRLEVAQVEVELRHDAASRLAIFADLLLVGREIVLGVGLEDILDDIVLVGSALLPAADAAASVVLLSWHKSILINPLQR